MYFSRLQITQGWTLLNAFPLNSLNIVTLSPSPLFFSFSFFSGALPLYTRADPDHPLHCNSRTQPRYLTHTHAHSFHVLSAPTYICTLGSSRLTRALYRTCFRYIRLHVHLEYSRYFSNKRKNQYHGKSIWIFQWLNIHTGSRLLHTRPSLVYTIVLTLQYVHSCNT